MHNYIGGSGLIRGTLCDHWLDQRTTIEGKERTENKRPNSNKPKNGRKMEEGLF